MESCKMLGSEYGMANTIMNIQHYGYLYKTGRNEKTHKNRRVTRWEEGGVW